MSAAELNPRPIRVSPLIKFSRWSLLAVGVVYGAFHQSRLSKKENARREQEELERPAREAKLAEERKRAAAAEIKALEELTQGK
ncbi:ATP synthase subunit e, mitochondrial [Nasonia vitripennis]|uniref:ATP synthase F(0) complex subunit e, mitochondrial n=1 Tax=Nasonia vitripennis TaxID=7425 RepID=A0A7M6UDK3_NASVI|nr:ATP synthase subunit e, mitochondrial [Nasonia vitripennis]